MLDFSDPQGRIGLVVIALVVIAAGYLLWAKTAPPVPRPAPGQTLQNPFGTAPPGHGGAPAPAGPSPSAPFARGR